MHKPLQGGFWQQTFFSCTWCNQSLACGYLNTDISLIYQLITHTCQETVTLGLRAQILENEVFAIRDVLVVQKVRKLRMNYVQCF